MTNQMKVDLAQRLLRKEIYPVTQSIIESDFKLKAGRFGRRAGKSVAAKLESLIHAILKPHSKVLLVIGVPDQTASSYNDAVSMLNESGIGYTSSYYSKNSGKLTLKNGSVVKILTPTETHLHGQSPDKLVIDEANEISDAEWRRITATISDKPIIHVSMFGTPCIYKDDVFKSFCFRQEVLEIQAISPKAESLKSLLSSMAFYQEVLAEWLPVPATPKEQLLAILNNWLEIE